MKIDAIGFGKESERDVIERLLDVAKVPWVALVDEWLVAADGAMSSGETKWSYGRSDIAAMYAIAEPLSEWVRTSLFEKTFVQLEFTGCPITWEDLQDAYGETSKPPVLLAAANSNWPAVLQLLCLYTKGEGQWRIRRHHMMANVKGWSLLHVAINTKQNVEMIRMILDLMEQTDCLMTIETKVPDVERTALFLAMELNDNGSEERVQLLLDYGASSSSVDHNSRTMLMAAARGNTKNAIVFLNHSSNIENIEKMIYTIEKKGWGCIGIAAFKGNYRFIDSVFSAYSDILGLSMTTTEVRKRLMDLANFEYILGTNTVRTPLVLASERGNAQCVRTLLKWGANIINSGTENYSPLLIASNCGHNDVVWELTRGQLRWDTSDEDILRIKSSLMNTSTSNWNPLQAAAHSAKHRVVRSLLSFALYLHRFRPMIMTRADLDAFANVRHEGRGLHGRTPLHFAAQRGNRKAVNAFKVYEFVHFGITDNLNFTPLQLAEKRGYACDQTDDKTRFRILERGHKRRRT
tara:strand:- start:1862 stop:3424 length:1563 start_codon:yes stop_codon:yes gene_type:complete